MRKIVAMAVICLTAASGLTSAYAAQLADDEAGLRIRLKNELRRADKPSAGAGRDIYAWVQGGLLDFNSGYYSNIIGVEGGALMNPLMILVKIIKLRWIHILSYDQMVSRKINNQTTRCANSIF
ncbi:hypothetical protein Q2304_21710, partial [Escherichia coli]|nr:hypothetical protein [Escherichia coli]